MRESVSAALFASGCTTALQICNGGLAALPADRLETLALLGVVELEEVGNALKDLRIHVLARMTSAETLRRHGNSEQSIVADALAVFDPFGPQYGDDATRNHRADRRRLIGQHDDVERIAVLAERGRHKTERVRERRPGR